MTDRARRAATPALLLVASVALAFALSGLLAGTAQAAVTNGGMSLYGIYLSKGGNTTQYDPNDREASEFGDAVLMESEGEYLLMDAGQSWCADSLVSYLKKAGVKRHLSEAVCGIFLLFWINCSAPPYPQTGTG